MSKISYKYQSDDSVNAINDLSRDDPNILINSEKNRRESENGTKHNLNSNIGDVSLDGKRNLKDNLKKNLLNLKSGKKSFLGNDSKIVNCENGGGKEDIGDNVKFLPYNKENLCSVEVEHYNIHKELKESNNKNKLELLQTENEKILNSYTTEETNELVMKAAFSKVAEHFGLSSPDGNTDASQIFYGVYIPSDSNIKSSDEETLHIYTEKVEALKVMKQSKKARLKQFKTKKEALHFVLHGLENLMQPNSMQCSSGGEKVMPFKCPKIQDMISFKKAIECGDVEEIRKKILENPRYLVSSGDTPSILQEGSRYNALHVAAKAKNVEIIRLILNSITNAEFISYLYDDNDFGSCKERIEVLLDLYLNMPDKGLNETPLHIAVKHGALDVVEYLLSYPQCQRSLVNKFNQQPKDIICSRISNASESLKNSISALLEDQYYIPVLRSEDNTIQPRVGETFSPSKPLSIPEDLLSPRIEVQAYAGPMSKESADVFKKKWKSPPRAAKNFQTSSLRLRDMEKGLERIGRSIARELKVPWMEYWPFLDTFVDLTSEEGLQILEEYLGKRFNETLEMVNNKKTTYLGESAEKVVSPMTSLCEAMRFCSLNDISNSSVQKIKWSPSNCEKYESHKKINNNFESDIRNPLLYVERCCEVFGKRVASFITSSSDFRTIRTEYIKDSLELQIKLLISNVSSYREDNRFQCVNFQMIHSRVASVAIHSLEDYTDRDRCIVLKNLKDIDWNDGTLSDDEDLTCNFRNLNQDTMGSLVKQHLHCFVQNLISEINNFKEKSDVSTATARNEADCTRLWALATPCGCSWSQNAHFRPRIGIKRKTPKYLKNNVECDLRAASARILTEVSASECDKNTCKTCKTEEETEEVYCTPPSGPSDSEGETMEDPLDIPDTFIYEGTAPSKIDYAVLDAIEPLDLASEIYPNICRWKHLVSLYSRSPHSNSGTGGRNTVLNSAQKKRISSVTTPNSSPGKALNKSISACDITQLGGNVEPWERMLGAYSPCTPKKTSVSLAFGNTDSPINR